MRQVILFGAGKSICEGESKGLYEKLKSKEIWSLNYAFMTLPFLPSRQLWMDRNFYKNNIEKLENLSKQGVSCHAQMNGKYKNIPDIKQYKISRTIKRIDNEIIFVTLLGLTGAFGLALAIKENYDEIFLLGYDFGTINVGDINTHYYQGKMDVISSGVGNINVYRQNKKLHEGLKGFDFYLEEANKKNIKIYNVNIDSNIKCFEKLTWEGFFSKLK